MGRLPNLLVIGAMKCGTSSLHRYLDLHPEVSMSRLKEPNRFLPVDAEAAGPLLGERSSRARSRAWYEGQFEEAPVRGESSVAYSFPWFDGVAEAIAAELGAPRIVYVVRDPVQRMRSHLDQFADRDQRPPAEALLDDRAPYLRVSSFATALAPFLEQFGRDRILIVDADRLRADRAAAVAEVLGFLGLDPAPVLAAPALAEESNVGAGKGAAFRIAERVRSSTPGAAVAGRLPRGVRSRAAETLRGRPAEPSATVDEATRLQLLERLEPEIAGIERLTGWDLTRWRA